MRVVALAALRNEEKLFEQCREFHPDLAVLVEPAAAARLQNRMKEAGLFTQVRSGAEALTAVAQMPQADCVMAAIVGAAGLLPTLAAARAGADMIRVHDVRQTVQALRVARALENTGAA